MQKPFAKIGLTRVGRIGIGTQPARLVVTSDRITLLTVWATYFFAPEDVLSIESSEGFGTGAVRIRHIVTKYSELVYFWSGFDPNKIRQGIRGAGFTAKARAT